MSKLVAASTLCWHERGNLLPARDPAGEPAIFVIVSGHVVHVETSPENVRLSWALRGAGHILGISYMLDLGSRILEYIANDEVVAIHMPGRLLFEFLDKAPVQWKHMARTVLAQERTQIDLVVGQIVGTLAQRLASVVEQLAALYGVPVPEKDAIRIRLSQQSLADILQVGRQSVNKQLAAWAVLGVVRVQYNEIQILDAPALARISRPSAPSKEAGSRMNESRPSIADTMLMSRELRTVPAFSSWSSVAMEKLLSHSHVGRHSRGQVFSSELRVPSETFLIVSGEAMAARVSPQGERSVVTLLGPGVFMGMTQAFGKADRATYDFSAHSDVVAIHMPTPLILSMLDAEPTLWKGMLFMLVQQHAAHAGTLRSQIEGALQRRVAATIERLAGLYGSRIAESGGVRLQLSQSNLATMLQANRQAINKELKALADTGAIGLEYNALTVLAPDALRRAAKPGSVS